jgi:hypothetical protein
MISDQNRRERSLCSKASQCFVDTKIVNHKPTNLLGLDINEDESASIEQSAQQYRILIIDDEPDVALSLKAGLEDEQEEKQGIGFAVYTFNDPTEALSKNIIEAHGGRIWAENNANGNGATFSFSLPINN